MYKKVNGKLNIIIHSILLSHGVCVDCEDDHGVCVDCEDEYEYTPLYYAIKAGNLSNILKLIEHGANVNYGLNKRTKKDHHMKTPLFKARTPDTVRLLLSKGANPAAEGYEKKNDKNVTAVEYIMKFSAESAWVILDHCMSIENETDMVMDFSIFENANEESEFEMSLLKTAQEECPMSSVTDNSEQPLLLHPLLLIFLHLKFKTVKRVFYIRFVIHFIIVLILTCTGVYYTRLTSCKLSPNNVTCFENNYFITKTCPIGEKYVQIELKDGTVYEQFSYLKCHKNLIRFISDDHNDNHKHIFLSWMMLDNDDYYFHNDYLEKVCNNLGASMEDCWDNHYLISLTYFSLLVLILKELIELSMKLMISYKQSKIYCYGLLKYLFSLDNFVDILLVVFLITFLITCRVTAELSLHFAAWMVFLAWINLTLHLGRFSPFSEYIYMSRDVTYTMMLCLITYLPNFTAFTFGFHILLHSNEAFSGWIQLHIGVFEKMLGEMNYVEDFEYSAVKDYGGRNISAQFMFLLFLIFISLIVMNLLITVTLSKTENLATRCKLMMAHEIIDEMDNLRFSYTNFTLVKKLPKIGYSGRILAKCEQYKCYKVGNIIYSVWHP